MKKKILMLLLLTITILITLGGLNQTDAARICANCKAGNHVNCPNRGYTHNSTSHSIWCCCGKTFANAEMHYVNHYSNNSTYCYICVCGYKEKHNTSGGHCSKAHCPYNSSRTLCNRGCNHAKWVSCRDHSYSSTWTRTATHHWKKCTVSSSCTATKSYGAHVDNNGDGKCDVCEISEGTSSSTNDGGGGNAEATDPKPGAPVVNVKGTNFTGTSENNVVYSNSNVSWNIETEDSVSKKPLKLTEYDLSGATTGGNAVTRAGRYNRNGSNAGINSQWVSSVPSTYTFETWIYLPVYGGKSYYIFHTGKGRYSQLYISSAGNLVLYNSSKVYRSYVSQAELQRLGFYSGWAYLSVQAINGKDMNRSNVVIYINGQQAELSIKGTTSSAADMAKSRLQLGGYYSNNNVGLPDGSMMKETKIFNTGVAASSADRMYTEMNSSSTYWSNLIGYWKQVETSGSTMVATAGVSGMYANNADADSARDVSSNYISAALTNNKFTGTISAEGTTRITANHVGMLGATSETTVDVVIDKTAPTGTIFASTYNTNQNSVTLYVTASDDSGISGVTINGWYGGNWSQYNSSKSATYNNTTGQWEVTYNFSEIQNTTSGATNQGQGIYYFDAHIYDNAGNWGIASAVTVAYDTQGPSITGSVTGTGLTGSYPTFYTRDVTSTVTINFTGIADNLSGASHFDYYIRRDGSTRTYDYNAGQAVDEDAGTGYVKYTLNGQGKYVTEIYIYDRAGNCSACGEMTIIADHDGPWILSGSVEGATLKDDGKYYVTDPTGVVTLNNWDMGDNLSGLSHFDYYLSKDGAARTKIYNAGTAINIGTDSSNTTAYVKYKFNGYGTYTTERYIYDKAGNLSACDVKTFIVAPESSQGVIYTSASLTNQPTVTISVEASDESSGVANVIIYGWKGTTTAGNNVLGQGFVGGNATYNSSTGRWEKTFTFNDLPDRTTCEKNQGDGIYAFDAHVVNNAGTDTYISPVNVTYDSTAPTVVGITYNPGWKKEPVTINVHFTDALSGVNLIEYSYDLNSWYSDWDSGSGSNVTKTWSEEGDRVVYFRATDYAGNTWIYAHDGTNPSPYDLKIDKTLPNGTVSASTTCTNQNSVTIYVNATDALSGVDQVKMMAWTGSKDWVKTNTEKSTTFNSTTGLWEVSFTFDEIRDTTTGALSQGDGNYYFGAHIYDKAGNRRIVDGTAVIYDTTPPQITSITYDPGWKNVDITKEIEATDTLSGVKLIEYSYDLTTWYSDWESSGKGYAKRTWTEEGDRVVYFRATDNAGNIWVYTYTGESPTPYDLKIDKTIPEIGTYTVSGTTVVGGKHYVTSENAEITLNFTGMSDNLSGLKNFDYYLRKDGAERTYDYNVEQSITGSTGYVKYKLNGYGTYTTEIYLYDNATNHRGYQILTINAVESIPTPELMDRDFLYFEDPVPSIIGARRADSNTSYLATQVKTIKIINRLETPEPTDYVDSWDVSYIEGDNTVTAWIVRNATDNSMYDLYIGANDTILAPENAESLFADYDNCESIIGLENLSTVNVTNMDSMFARCNTLQYLDVTSFDTSKVESMYGMFEACYAMNSLNVTTFDTSNVTAMSNMFLDCYNLTEIDVYNFDTTNVTEMENMFSNCSSLSSIDLSSLNISNVTTMGYIFAGCENLTNINIDGLDTSNLARIEGMFNGCSSLKTVDFSNFDLSHAIEMSYLFTDCSSLEYLDLSHSNVMYADPSLEMFKGCTKLKSINLGENFNTLNPQDAFVGCNSLTAIIVMAETPLTLDTAGGLSNLPNAILYVPSVATKATYEAATNYSTVFGANRIRPILELVGNNPVKVSKGATYVDSGVTVAGMTKNADGTTYTPYGYTVSGPVIKKDGTVVSSIDTSTKGTYTYTYTVKDSANVEGMSVTRDVIVKENPTLMEREPGISATNYQYYAIGAYRADNSTTYTADKIKKITLIDLNKESAPTTYVTKWDASYTNGDGDVTAWLVTNSDDNTMHDLYLGAKGKILAPAYSKLLFGKYKNCIEINGLNNLDTSKVTNMNGMFYLCSSLTSLDVSNFETSNVTDMFDMFGGCASLTSLDVSNFDTSNVTSMGSMFFSCSSLISLDVSGFNTSEVTNMNSMFSNCSSLPSLDVTGFDTSNVTIMTSMFSACSNLTNLDVTKFNTTNVKSMYGMFESCKSLTSLDVSNFDTSNVTNMGGMFVGCSSLTSLDVSNFNTSNVTDMGHMFYNCSSLISLKLGKNFDKLTGADMFRYCSKLKAIITPRTTIMTLNDNTTTDTCLKTLTNAILYVPSTTAEATFEADTNYADIFGADRIKPILELIGETPVKVTKDATYVDSGVTVAGMTKNADGTTYTPYGYTVSGPVIKKDGTVVSKIDTSARGIYTYTYTVKDSANVEGMSVTRDVIVKDNPKLMTREAANSSNNYQYYAIGAYRADNRTTYTADKIKKITLIDLSKESAPTTYVATWDASYTSGDGDVTAWLVTNAEDSTMYDLYLGAEGKIYAPSFSVYLFKNYKNCVEINGLSNLDTSNVTRMYGMFSYCSSLISLDVSDFDTSSVTDMKYMFEKCSSLTGLNVSNLDTSNVTDMVLMFYACSSLTNLDVSGFNTSKLINMYGMFESCSSLTNLDVSNFDTSNVTSMQSTFSRCSSLTSLDINNFNTSNVTSMVGMFENCSSLTNLDVSGFNTSKVTNMGSMFSYCESLINLDVSGFDTTNVTRLGNMFDTCSSLINLDVSNFDTTNVISMDGMFHNCRSLTNLDVSGFNTSKVTNMRYMFYECRSLTSIDVSGFDTNKVTDMYSMFAYCKKLTSLDLSSFDTSNVTNMGNMFDFCSSLTNLDASSFDTSKVTDMTYMFKFCSNLISLRLGQNFDKLIGREMFYSCPNLKAIITPRTTIMTLNDNTTTSTGLKTNAILYVPSTAAEATFEANANYADIFGADRIRPILELVGDNSVKVSKGATYVDSGVTVAGMTKNADGLAYTPYGYTVSGPVIKKDGTVVSSVDTSNVGTYTLTYTVHEPNSSVDGMSVTREVEIESKDISENNPDITVSISTEDRVYKDAAYTPVVTVKDGTTTLVEGTDYSVSYSDNINAGMATVTIKGINNYTGTRTENFMITQRPVTIKPKDATKEYDTLPLTSNEPEVTAGSLVDGHTATITTTGSITSVGSITNTISTLTIKNASGTDVTANYNVTKATGTLTITSAGSVTFDITLDNNTFEYDGTIKTPTATVKVGSITLEAGTDYDVSYKNNKDAGTATITITGKENYDGSIGTKEFTITKRKLTIKAWSVDKVYDGMPLTSSKFEITSGSVPSEQTLTVTTSGSITNVGTTSNKIATYKIIASSEDVTKNYDVTTLDGTLKVTPATITGSVKITGTNTFGQTLTASVTTNPTDCTLTYNWYYSTSATATSGTSMGTGSTVMLNDTAYLGKYVFVTVTASKANYNNATFSDRTDSANNGSDTVKDSSIVITTNPSNLAVKEGVAGSFSVAATGTNLKYQWYKATSTTAAGTAITGATGATYSITAANMVRGLNGSYYYCVVSNDAGSATSTRALLTVYYAPSINTQPTDQSVNVGTKATFAIVANAGNPSTTTYKWQYRTSSSGTWADCTTTQGTGVTTSSFTTVATTMAMNGYQYRCIIGNVQYPSVATSNAATLTVKKLNITPKVNMTGYTYGDTLSTPSVTGNTGNGTVTYYYNTTNSNTNGTNWSTVTSSTSLNAGTYYMYAVIGATTNYNGATTSAVPFVVAKRDLTIKPKDATKVYDTLPLTSNEPEVTAGSLVSGHTVTITTTGSIINIGSVDNTISTLTINKADGTDVTANYNVTKAKGTLTITSAGSVDFDITLDNNTFEYDGTVKEPTPTVKVGSKTLVAGTDYEVSYKNNKDAGTATVIITGKGNYEGSIGEKTFKITKRAITVKANDASKAYDTLPLTNNTYTITSGTLAQDHTMTVTISGTITDVGSVPNTITNVVIKDASNRDVTKNYDITKQAGTLTITSAKDAKFDITLDKDTFVYDGTAKTPTPTVKVGTTTLVKGTDYDVSYKDNVNAGTATVTITGKGNYAGAIGEKTFTITKVDIIPTVNMSDYVYGGTKAEPSVNGNTGNGNVTYYYNTSNSNSNGTNWTTVTSSTSLSAGTYYMYAVIEETANYKGATTPTKEFKITSIDISENNPDITATIPSEERIYKDAEYRPEVTLKNGTETLVLNKDYTVTYTNNINAGMATITITGINNYSGSRTINFMISKRPITIKPKDVTKVYDRLPLTSTVPEVTVGSLVSGHEITLTTTGTITNIGTVENTISTLIIKNASATDVTSNYDITKGVGTLTVTEADNVDFDITLDNDSFVYDGTPKEPGLTIKVNGVTLEEGKDYDVSYKNNKDAGTATVTITGKGNYEGSSSTKDFTITKRPLEITAGSASKVYNGTALTSSAFSITSGTSLAPDQTLSVTTSGTITNVGTTSNVIATYTIYHNGENVTANYSVTLKEGTLEVKPATITGSVIITGTNRLGKTLTAEVTVNPSDASLTYAWYYGTTNDINNATAITGANAKTYSPTTDKIGMYIFVKVTASKENYNDATFTDITDNENNKVEKVGDRLTPYLMAREVQTVTSNGVTSEKAGYAIGAYRAGKTKYTSDLIKSVTIINLLETNAPTTYEAMWDASRDENEAVYAWTVKNQTNSSMYDLYIGGEGTLVLTNGKRLFADYTKCDNINGLNKMNSTNVTDMSYMFSNLASMSTLDVSVVNTSSVTNMEGMFMTNNLTTLNVSGFDTSKVTNMSKMFKESSNLTSLNINGFNTANTNNMSQMFMDCGNITSLNVSAFNTSNVTNMSAMFMGMSKIETLNVTNFNTVNVTDMSSMFASCLKVQRLDLHTFNTTKVTNISGMFTADSSMKSVLLGEEFNKLNGSNMFTGCSSLKAIIAQKKITASSEAMTLSATGTGLNTLTNATLYVPNLESKGYYETATNYATVFGEARVKPILEIIGANPVHVTVGAEYVDQGARVAGFEESEATEYTVYGYTLSVSGLPVDTSTVGTKLVIYTVKYKDQVVVTGATW